LFDKNFLLAGKSIRREKETVKENNRTKGIGKKAGNQLRLSEV
jgi:hypothetical protein